MPRAAAPRDDIALGVERISLWFDPVAARRAAVSPIAKAVLFA
jgi:hypothetical protein